MQNFRRFFLAALAALTLMISWAAMAKNSTQDAMSITPSANASPALFAPYFKKSSMGKARGVIAQGCSSQLCSVDSDCGGGCSCVQNRWCGPLRDHESPEETR